MVGCCREVGTFPSEKKKQKNKRKKKRCRKHEYTEKAIGRILFQIENALTKYCKRQKNFLVVS